MLQSDNDIIKTDVAIIGAGPSGLFSIFECGMLGMKCVIFDSLSEIGGQCQALYPEKPIYDIPAHPKIDSASLVSSLTSQAAPFQPVYYLNQRVENLYPLGNKPGWRLETTLGVCCEAKAIIIAAGNGAFGPNRPPIPDIETYEEESVFYSIPQKNQLKNKHIVIAGGGNSAVDWAVTLVDIAASISVVHRRSRFRATPKSEQQLMELVDAGQISLVVPYQLYKLVGSQKKISEVIVSNFNNETISIKADVLLPFFGLNADLGPITNWGLDLDQNRITVNSQTMMTSIPGIFAIGDVAHYPRKLKLIITGFAEAAIAAHAIHSLVFPNEELHFQYSTVLGTPGSPRANNNL